MNQLLNRQRLTSLMEQAELDVIIASTAPNVLYCTGMYSLSHWLMNHAQAYAVISRDTSLPSSMVLPISDIDLAAEQDPQVDRLYTYGTFYVEQGTQSSSSSEEDERLRRFAAVPPAGTAKDALHNALRELSRRAHRIGVDSSRMPDDVRQSLSVTFPSAEFIAADDLLIRSRMVKTPEEQARLKRSAAITERGMMTVIEQLREGMTELEAKRIFESVIVEEGARPALTVIGFGPHSAYPNATPGPRRLQAGDIVRFDVGCVWHHYWSDLSRCAVFGSPSKRVVETYQMLIDGEDAAIEMIKPGIHASEVFAHVMNVVKSAGLTNYRRQHVGHGVGLEVYDPPILGPGVSTVLEPGMVLDVETPFYEVGFGGLQIEDLVLVTQSGCEVLTQTERKLYIRS